jgi:hypothetical protein
MGNLKFTRLTTILNLGEATTFPLIVYSAPLHRATSKWHFVPGLPNGPCQIANLILALFYGHNLCFICPNGPCKPILHIYVSIVFQCYKKFFKLMGFDPWNRPLKVRESNWDSNSQNGSSLGSVRVYSLTLFCTPGSSRCDSQVSLLARNLANPCLGGEPKAMVATIKKLFFGKNLTLKNIFLLYFHFFQ